MTKTILVMRHAKSSWATAGMDDHQRPLNKRGLRDAPVMAKYIVDQGLVPGIVYYSSAKRTKMTMELLGEVFSGQTTLEGKPFSESAMIKTKDLYHAPWATYVKIMSSLADENVNEETSSVMLLGHNPGIESLLEKLTGQYETMPTAAVARIELDADSWADCKTAMWREGKGYRLKSVWRPKEI